jgi:hypothetical protein
MVKTTSSSSSSTLWEKRSEALADSMAVDMVGFEVYPLVVQWLLFNGCCSMVVQWLFDGCSMVVQWLFNGCCSMVVLVVQWLFDGCSMVVVQWLLFNGCCSMVAVQWLLFNGCCSMVVQ